MKLKKSNIVLIVILFCAAFLYLSKYQLQAKESVDLFNDIIIKTNSKVVEYGVQAAFKVNTKPIESCNRLLENFNLKSGITNILSNKDTYCVEFSKSNIKGYVEFNKYNNENILTVNINEISNKNGLVPIENKLKEFIGKNQEKISFYKYLKAKIPNQNQNNIKTNKLIINMLKEIKSENIQTVKLNNGFSTVANTKIYEPRIIDNKYIDFNYSICRYSSGIYMILGTPEIIISY